MRLVKMVISLALVGMLAYCWSSVLGSTLHSSSDYEEFCKRGELSYEEGLYKDAYENFTKALELKPSEKLTDRQIEAFRMYYEDEGEGSYEARKEYLSALEKAYGAYPKRVDFAVTAVGIYLDAEEFADAKKICRRALDDNGGNEDLEAAWRDIITSYKLDANYYSDYREGADGYYRIKTETKWERITFTGTERSDLGAEVIGTIGPAGIHYIKRPGKDGRFYDTGNVSRGIAKEDYLDAGAYTEGLCSVQKKNKKWGYVDLDGNEYFETYDMAGSFSDGKAAVKKGKGWYLIDREGNKIPDSDFADIKLDIRGCCFAGGRMAAAKKKGEYRLWDDKLNPVGDIQSEDMGIPTEDGYIAIKMDGVWGYADEEGNVVIEPSYDEAKSFTYGLGAVCEGEKWGYITADGIEAVEPEFSDAGYVNSAGSAMVKPEETYYCLLTFSFPDDLRA